MSCAPGQSLLPTIALLIARGVARSKYVGWTDMARAEREPITGVWRRSDPLFLPPVKHVGFVSISGATSSKSGVDMSTPAVHPVATPMLIAAVLMDVERKSKAQALAYLQGSLKRSMAAPVLSHCGCCPYTSRPLSIQSTCKNDS